MISDYFREVEGKITEKRIIVEKRVDYREFSSDEGMIRGRLLFIQTFRKSLIKTV